MNRALLGLVVACATMFTACKKEDETPKGPCQEEYETSYQDYKTIGFTINGSETLYQNYGMQSYPANAQRPSDYLVKFEGNNVTLNLERIELEGDQCEVNRQHWVIIKLALDQTSYETKEYIVGSALSQTNYQNYASYTGELLNDGETIRFSVGDNCGKVTVTKYIPPQKFEGYFEIDINGIDANGKFKIDLTKDY